MKSQPNSQVNLIIERAKQENFNENEIALYNDFFAEGGIKNPAKMTEQDATNFVNFLDSCDASNEFVAMALNRLAQIAPASVIAQVLESDADGDGLTLAEELKLGTKATQYDTPAQIAVAQQRQFQAFPSRNSEFEL
ncbi:hypothetical protein [Scytonema sp. PRP1]|uniref:hypothetical protein n=1 Tax=Scytonema sp. PRP1 TaxID=3120513 RepID=UPI00300C7A3E